MAATVDITMPQLGETVTEGTITRWFKAVGDQVAEDEPLFEVSTDKVDTEVPSSASGFVGEILVAEGETVDVGAKLAVITPTAPDGSGHGGGGTKDEGAEAEGAEAMDGHGAEADEDGHGAEAKDEGAEAMDEPEKADAADAADASQDHDEPSPTPRDSAPPTDPSPDQSGSRLLSPLVRRLLSEHGIDAAEVTGTGVDGRITRADVMAHIGRQPRANGRAPAGMTAPASGSNGRAAEGSGQPGARPRGGDQVVPFSNIRRRTAEHMVRSQSTSAHVLVAIEVDFDNVDRVRLAERERFKAEEGFSLTYLPFVARAAIDAIAEFPRLNASVGNDELVVHGSVNLGIAVDLSFEGLIVPVIHDADTKRMRAVAREIADLAARARSRKLNADEIAGSTFTITNPGSYGTFITAPVINQPHVAILSTDGVRKRPVVVAVDGSDAIAIHPVGMLAMSFDHRAFDGAYASAFLAKCREILETRDWSQEL